MPATWRMIHKIQKEAQIIEGKINNIILLLDVYT